METVPCDVVVIIPALNEDEALPDVLAAIPSPPVSRVVVVDNGSTDRTADVARSFGALVIAEPRRGYGAACLAGVRAAEPGGIIVFLDGDRSADPAEIPLLIQPIADGRADLVIGSRILGRRERGALLPQARFGNALAAALIRMLFGRRMTDLGPFRALTREAWEQISPDDRAFGFPVQLQVRALARNLRVVEVPTGYRRRIGRSKISGTLLGTIGAGWGIMSTILAEYLSARRDA